MSARQKLVCLSKLLTVMVLVLVALVVFCRSAYAATNQKDVYIQSSNLVAGSTSSGDAYWVASNQRYPSFAFSWSFDGNGTLTLSACDANKKSSLEEGITSAIWADEPFTTVDTGQIKNNLTQVTELVIGGGIKKVNGNFKGKFPNLETVVIGSSVESMASTDVFTGLTKLSEVDFSNATSLKSLATGAFSGCTSLKELDLSNTAITEMGDGLETGCILQWGSGTPALEKIVCPKGLETVGASAFSPSVSTCSLKTVVLWDKVKSIGQNAFMNCTELETVYVPSSLGSFDTDESHMGTTAGSSTDSVLSKTTIVVYPVGDTIDGSKQDIKSCGIDKLIELTDSSYKHSVVLKVVFPGKAVYLANALDNVADNDPDVVQKVLDADAAFKACTDEQKAAPCSTPEEWTAEFWSGIRAKIDKKAEAIWTAIFSSDTSTATAQDKLEICNRLMSSKNEEISKLKADYEDAVQARAKAEENYSEIWKMWLSASEAASGVNSMKANYERQLKEAQAKVDEAAAKVAELEKQLDSDQSAAEAAAAKAEVVSLQDQLAVRSYADGSKTVKLNKKGRTKAKSVVRLKLVKSASGAAVSCAKAKGTSKKVTVSDTGVVTLKKGVKKGAYKAVVTFTCGKATNTVTITFKAA